MSNYHKPETLNITGHVVFAPVRVWIDFTYMNRDYTPPAFNQTMDLAHFSSIMFAGGDPYPRFPNGTESKKSGLDSPSSDGWCLLCR